ncbi:hypothetical protein Pcinc_039777 [Petrolisthes cinctipes]|uniref:Uncharacterized protein n=1 Tax=Petrolisthes cinctipes TaxID=88211 RepID=A0AAE1BR15_PETCI|nr:hypothetical protein Pcinc_039777 [Petrolisthes cinctipes]
MIACHFSSPLKLDQPACKPPTHSYNYLTPIQLTHTPTNSPTEFVNQPTNQPLFQPLNTYSLYQEANTPTQPPILSPLTQPAMQQGQRRPMAKVGEGVEEDLG